MDSPKEHLETASAPLAQSRRVRVLLAIQLAIVFALGAIWVFASPGGLTAADWSGLLIAAAPLAIAAMAQLPPIVGGGQGLSAGATLILCAAVATTLPGISPALAITSALATGLAIGALNGMLIGILRLRSTPVTLAVGSACLASALSILSSASSAYSQELSEFVLGWRVSGIPVLPVVALLLLCVLGEGFLASPMGRTLRQSPGQGRSPATAVPLCLAYVIAGGGAGLGGVLLGGAYGSMDVALASPVLLQILAAIALGGGVAGLRGGSVIGALLGAVIVSLSSGLLIPLGIPDILASAIDSGWLLVGAAMALIFGAPRESDGPAIRDTPERPRSGRLMLAAIILFIAACAAVPALAAQATMVSGLALLASGQLAVLRLRSIDLSMPVIVSATAIGVVTLTQGRADLLLPVVLVFVVAAVAAGLLLSTLAARLGRPVLVFPLVLAGFAQSAVAYMLVSYPTGFAPPILTELTYRSWLGLPVAAWVLLALLALAQAAPQWARMRSVERTYPFVLSVVASVAFGVILAGYGGSAHFTQLDTFMLPTIAIAFLTHGISRHSSPDAALVLPIAVLVVGVDTALLAAGLGTSSRMVAMSALVIAGEALHWRRMR